MKLHELADNDGARRKRKRIGRGPGSGTGKTGGRGIKGQKSRSGVAIKGFEGGQMPLHRRLPKRGFSNRFRKQYSVVNLRDLQRAIDEGKLDAATQIDVKALIASGLVRRELDGVRVLAKGELTAKVEIVAAGASKAAVEAIEKAGGSVTVVAPKSSAPAETADAG